MNTRTYTAICPCNVNKLLGNFLGNFVKARNFNQLPDLEWLTCSSCWKPWTEAIRQKLKQGKMSGIKILADITAKQQFCKTTTIKYLNLSFSVFLLKLTQCHCMDDRAGWFVRRGSKWNVDSKSPPAIVPRHNANTTWLAIWIQWKECEFKKNRQAMGHEVSFKCWVLSGLLFATVCSYSASESSVCTSMVDKGLSHL